MVAEEFRVFRSSPEYIVNAFFENDKITLTDKDTEHTRSLLALNRHELLSLVSGLPAATLDRPIPNEVQQNIRGILRHIDPAEWWYWDRLGLAFPRSDRPDDVLEMLNKVRDHTLEHLPEFIGGTQTKICSGEQWSRPGNSCAALSGTNEFTLLRLLDT